MTRVWPGTFDCAAIDAGDEYWSADMDDVCRWAERQGYRTSAATQPSGAPAVYVDAEDEAALVAEWAIAGYPGAYEVLPF